MFFLKYKYHYISLTIFTFLFDLFYILSITTKFYFVHILYHYFLNDSVSKFTCLINWLNAFQHFNKILIWLNMIETSRTSQDTLRTPYLVTRTFFFAAYTSFIVIHTLFFITRTLCFCCSYILFLLHIHFVFVVCTFY